ncbi:MAG: outer membrane beta-barrel family protein, partial [Muribaculaceae bacterium]|nr:outer membrane beta-barrel family protein [Muribaculaceae bacterium]
VSSANSASLTEEPADTVKSHELNEVVFTESREIRKDDHTVLLMSDANRKFGTNALDAISSLNRFQTELNGDKLVSWDNSEVFILINGVPSTGIDLRSYQGSDIKNVEYYAVAPPKYMMYTKGTIINVIVKRRQDRLYSGYINAKNAVTTGFGDNQIALTYADSLNQVKVGYYLSYRDVHDIDNLRTFDYSPSLSTRYDNTRRYKGEYHKWNASYQRYQGNHLFNARIYYITDPVSEPAHGTGTIFNSSGSYSGISASDTKGRSNIGTLDLYYNYTTDKGRTFAINIVNTLGSSRSDSYRSLSFASPYDYMNYNVGTNVRNSTYSGIVSAMFTTRMLGGRFQAGSKYEYSRLSQKTGGSKYTPSTHDEFLNAGIFWRKNDFAFFPALGVNLINQTTDDSRSNTDINPFAQIYAAWQPTGKFKGFITQLTLAYMDVKPKLNQLTGSYTYGDQWMLSTGNPYLKSNVYTYAILDITYFQSGSSNRIGLKIQPYYIHDFIQPILFHGNGCIVSQPQNIKSYFQNDIYINGSWRPVKWLELAPYMSLTTSRFDTPNRQIRENVFRVGGKVVFTADNWAAILAANCPTRDYAGDFVSRGSSQYAAIVQYKY